MNNKANKTNYASIVKEAPAVAQPAHGNKLNDSTPSSNWSIAYLNYIRQSLSKTIVHCSKNQKSYITLDKFKSHVANDLGIHVQ